MKTTYDLYHKTHPDQASTDRRGTYTTRELARGAAGEPLAWEPWGAESWSATAGPRDHWLILAEDVPETDRERIELTLGLLKNFGQEDGSHHLAWVIDQAARYLAPDYEAFIAEYQAGEDGPETYSWDTGIAPGSACRRRSMGLPRSPPGQRSWRSSCRARSNWNSRPSWPTPGACPWTAWPPGPAARPPARCGSCCPGRPRGACPSRRSGRPSDLASILIE